jgi:uncharacterized protein (TIGR04222 family)
VNPFDLRGPEFLLLYAAFGVAVLTAAAIARRVRESGPPPRLDLSDPYLAACLRGGRDEAIRVALLGLVDRGLVSAREERWSIRDGAALLDARHPLDQALLRRLGGEGELPSATRADAAVQAACADLDERLAELGLVAGAELRRERARRTLVAIAVLVAPAAVKICLALQRGHRNVGLLIASALVFTALAIRLRGGRVTGRGRRVLRDLRSLYGDLRRRADSIAPGSGGELALLAGVFGLAAVPVAVFPHATALAGPRAGDGWSSSSFASGTSCGGGPSCGGGSSCGGSSCGGSSCGGCGS